MAIYLLSPILRGGCPSVPCREPYVCSVNSSSSSSSSSSGSGSSHSSSSCSSIIGKCNYRFEITGHCATKTVDATGSVIAFPSDGSNFSGAGGCVPLASVVSKFATWTPVDAAGSSLTTPIEAVDLKAWVDVVDASCDGCTINCDPPAPPAAPDFSIFSSYCPSYCYNFYSASCNAATIAVHSRTSCRGDIGFWSSITDAFGSHISLNSWYLSHHDVDCPNLYKYEKIVGPATVTPSLTLCSGDAPCSSTPAVDNLPGLICIDC